LETPKAQPVMRHASPEAGPAAPSPLPPPLPQRDPAKPAAERLPRIGEVVSGRYRVSKFLGMGGMGKVMAAEHVVLRHAVAIKFLHPHLVQSKTAQRRFAREARASAVLSSPHAIRILDVDQLPWGAPYLVMEHLEGHSLEKLIFEKRLPSADDAVRWMVQACHALAEAHARGIVHRDVKPENLFLATSASGPPTIKVLDLGLAKWLEDDALSATGETATNAAVGSPQYMSPEQILGKPVDHRADLWALGVTLYELLAGRPPFVARTVQDLFRRILHAPVRSLAELRPDLSPALVAVVMRCLERERGRRWPSATDLASALAATLPEGGVLAARVTSAPPPVRTERSSTTPFVREIRTDAPSAGRRHPRALLAVLAVATIGAVALSTFALAATARAALHHASAAPPPPATTLPAPAASAKPPADF
jgi:serine/threonine protein kinase